MEKHRRFLTSSHSPGNERRKINRTEVPEEVAQKIENIQGKFNDSSDKDTVMYEHMEILQGDVAVYVSDISGTTKTTREHGIFHYCSIVLKQRVMTTPILRYYGATHIFFEADDIWAIFPDPKNAVRAALEAMAKIREFNAQQDSKWRINMSGVGIAYGPGVVIDKEDNKFYGETVDKGFLLGEDIVTGSKVIMTKELYEAISEEEYHGVTFEIENHEEAGDYYASVGEYPPQTELGEEDCPAYAPLLNRWENKENCDEIDASLQSYIAKTRTCVMWGADWPTINEAHGVETMLTLYSAASKIIKKTFKKNGATYFEPTLYVFDDTNVALQAAISARESIFAYNAEHELKIPFEGFGIHVGDLFVVPETDIHWGDLVNTSSKLGEDIATGGVINMSKEAFNQLDEKPDMEPQQSEVSGNTLIYYVF